jgi:hypothetical protein
LLPQLRIADLRREADAQNIGPAADKLLCQPVEALSITITQTKGGGRRRHSITIALS